MEYRIDGSVMLTREAAHCELRRALDLPEYYGNNLDALWDMLTALSGSVALEHVPDMLNALGAYGCRLLQTMYEAAGKNGRLQFYCI